MKSRVLLAVVTLAGGCATDKTLTTARASARPTDNFPGLWKQAPTPWVGDRTAKQSVAPPKEAGVPSAPTAGPAAAGDSIREPPTADVSTPKAAAAPPCAVVDGAGKCVEGPVSSAPVESLSSDGRCGSDFECPRRSTCYAARI